MKIGILTQPLQRNYGGIIQNWALQETLRRMGHEPEMIFRQADTSRSRFGGITILRCCSLVKCIIYKILLGRRDVVLRNPFDRTYNPRQPRYADGKFIKRIQRSRICHSDRELREVITKNHYDAFIVGSDQVWRQEYSPRIETYFLDFLSDSDHRKKVAYAASFGVEADYINADKMQQCKTLLSRFDAVSVREDGGLRIVREDFGRHDVEKVLDPTLLLSDSDYRCLIKASDRLTGEKYITSYILDGNFEKQRILQDVSSRLSLPVRSLSGDSDNANMATVSQWLASFAETSFVVTDSFHGCVFSIIFNRPFIAIGNARRGLDRFTSLLEMFGLGKRLAGGVEDYCNRMDNMTSAIDYTCVNKELDRMRQSSLNFLKNALA